MIKRLKQLFEFGGKTGFYTPNAYDHDKGGPSVTLLFANTAHYLSVIIIAALAYKDVNNGAIAAITYSVITMVLYLMRRITSLKADLDDRSIELESEEKKDE